MTRATITLEDNGANLSVATTYHGGQFDSQSPAHQHAWLLRKMIDGLLGDAIDPDLSRFAAKFGLQRQNQAEPAEAPERLAPSADATAELIANLRRMAAEGREG